MCSAVPSAPLKFVKFLCSIFLYSVIFCFACFASQTFVQCSSFGSRSLLHAFVVSNLSFLFFTSPTSGLCSAFPLGSPQVYTLLFFFVLFSLLLLRVLCPTSSGLCSDFSTAPLEFARLIFCFVLFSFNFVLCVLSLTNFIFLGFPPVKLVHHLCCICALFGQCARPVLLYTILIRIKAAA